MSLILVTMFKTADGEKRRSVYRPIAEDETVEFIRGSDKNDVVVNILPSAVDTDNDRDTSIVETYSFAEDPELKYIAITDNGEGVDAAAFIEPPAPPIDLELSDEAIAELEGMEKAGSEFGTHQTVDSIDRPELDDAEDGVSEAAAAENDRELAERGINAPED